MESDVSRGNTEVRGKGEGRTTILALLPWLGRGAPSLSMLRAMRERGFDVTLAYYMNESVDYAGDHAEDFARDDRLIDMTKAPEMLGVDRLERCIIERGIGLLLQMGAPGAYRQIPYLKERMPRLCTLDMLYNPVEHTLNHFLYEACFDGVIVDSQAMRDYVLVNTEKTSPVVHLVKSGIDLVDFVPSARQEARPSPLVIGYVGRTSPEQNPLGFVEIAERLHAKMPELRFRMFGEGSISDEVRGRVAAGSAFGVIRFEGYDGHARDALQAIDVLVVPSKLDDRPDIVMEANACGVPVIGAPIGGIPELIDEGRNGHVISPEDHAAISRTISRWIEEPAVFAELRRRCRDTAERRFDRRQMMEHYAAVFAGTSRL
jgi:glycosyltransferase involved in cell wall biosynthesis